MTDIIAMHRADLVDAVTAAVAPIKAERDALAAELADFRSRLAESCGHRIVANDRIRELEGALRWIAEMPDAGIDISCDNFYEIRAKAIALMTPAETKDDHG